jgi:hypothetical protein
VGAGCLACRGLPEVATLVAPPPTDEERLVRAALAGYAVALPAGLVASEYVDSPVFSYVFPFVVGVVTGWAATAAARTDGRGQLGTRVRVIGAVLGVLGVALGFLLEKSLDPVSADVHVLLPYVAAVAGAVLWTAPPKPRATSDQDEGTEA